jgi:hypothetical protein
MVNPKGKEGMIDLKLIEAINHLVESRKKLNGQ